MFDHAVKRLYDVLLFPSVTIRSRELLKLIPAGAKGDGRDMSLISESL